MLAGPLTDRQVKRRAATFTATYLILAAAGIYFDAPAVVVLMGGMAALTAGIYVHRVHGDARGGA